MKTLLIIHVALVFMAFIKLKIVQLRIYREYVIPKSKLSVFEKILKNVYYAIVYCIPPFALLSLFVSEDEILKKVTGDMVKKDA